MKTRLFALSLVLSLGVVAKDCTIPKGATVLYAQSLPTTVHTVWTPSVVDATHDAPLKYTVSTDGSVVDVPVTACTPTLCTTTTTINSYGAHSTVVSAVNQKISTDPTSTQSTSAAAFQWALLQGSNPPTGTGVKQ